MEQARTALDELVGEIEDSCGKRWGLRLTVTMTEEAHDRCSLLADFLPYPPKGQHAHRLYLRGAPYVLVPQWVLAVALYPTPKPDGAIGETAGASLEGMAPHKVGNCQAWALPEAGVALVWEAYLLAPWRRSHDPREDGSARTLWQAWEQAVLRLAPTTRELRTPSREPVYDTAIWRAFLAGMGYRPAGKGLFWAKEVS